ncbi:DUF6304 family protein [Streptomyces sp. NPDC051133]|uniref:DUF6304 family protein n=1 Tax=Streptomyces sp. NPDC051133 TaxID=3155521 RepID=UPI0034336852
MSGRARWPGRFTDRHGGEDVVFESDGRELIRTTVRGVRFEGVTMDGLRAVDGEPPEGMFSFSAGALCSCLLEWEVPFPVERDGEGVREGTLHCALRPADPAGGRCGPGAETLSLELRLDGEAYRSATVPADFEDALCDLQRRLPAGTRMRACVACAWSDYHPVGHGLMADLACFRGAKDAYGRVDGKFGAHGIMETWEARTELVQETWLCEQFEHRAPGQGYRGTFP